MEWKKYFAWVFFSLGALPLGSMIIRYGMDNPKKWMALNVAVENPTLENILGCMFTSLCIAVIALFFHVWYKWK